MAGHSLFNQQDARSTFEDYLETMKKDIDSKSNEYILNVNVEEWKQYYIDKYDFIPLTIFPDETIVKYIGKVVERNLEYGQNHDREMYKFEVKVPFTGWSYLFMLRPSTRKLNHPQVSTPNSDKGYVTAFFILPEQNENRFEYEKNNIVNAITANTPYINTDLINFKAKVTSVFESTYNRKKSMVLRENAFFEKLNLNIEKDTDTIFKVPIAEKKRIPEPIVDKKTPKKYTENPTLSDEFYNDILDVIYTFFKSVEKKPSTYQVKDEEGLRDYILPTLETRYVNSTVTGETFNKGGKTDILVRYKDGTNLFIAECKFWKGEVALNETINQLFDRYLTWRDSKVAIIFFVTNKEFSKVLEVIQLSVKNHPYFVRENGIRGESSFSYVFHFPTDKGKHVFTEIMAFHFPEK